MNALKKAKMADLVNYRLRIVTLDGRQISGQMLAFDKHMNLVLGDAEEFRTTKKTNREDKRTLGLVILRGSIIVSVSVEAPPPSTDESMRLGTIKPGPGSSRAVSRGPSNAPTGPAGGPLLSGPIRTNHAAGGFGAPTGFQPPPGFSGR